MSGRRKGDCQLCNIRPATVYYPGWPSAHICDHCNGVALSMRPSSPPSALLRLDLLAFVLRWLVAAIEARPTRLAARAGARPSRAIKGRKCQGCGLEIVRVGARGPIPKKCDVCSPRRYSRLHPVTVMA